MTHSIRIFLLVTGCTALNAGCKKSTQSPEPYYGNYFPVNVGHWVEYDMDSTVYDAFLNGADTNYQYRIREEITEIFKDNEGRDTYRVERYKRTADSLPWIITDVWYANRFKTTAERVEENQRYIRLKLPPRNDAEWDGNAMNPQETWNYTYSNIHKAAVIGGLALDSTLTVDQIDEENLIEKKFSIEKYALHVGLVYKKQTILKTEVDGTIREGFDYTLTLRAWGD